MVATLVAFAVGYLVIIAFLKIVSTFSYKPFVIYRLVLAVVVVVLLTVGCCSRSPERPVAYSQPTFLKAR
ncbi:hypothetical protein NKG05_29305 [Oerskovia sp. M15]